jgi:thioredoxin-related protein
MDKNRLKFPVVLSILLLAFSCGKAQTPNFEDALKDAKAQNKKVIVDVYTDWCGWCKKMDRDTYSNTEIKQLITDNFIYVKLDAESDAKFEYNGKTYKSSEIAALFEVSGYPTTIFLDPDGKVIEFKYDRYRMNNLPGYYDADDFKKVLEYMRDERYKDTDLSTVL